MKTITKSITEIDRNLPVIEILSGTAMPKLVGKLWIGDPCYVFPDDRWSDFCSLMSSKKWEKCQQYLCRSYGIEWFATGTAYGDGCYPVYVYGKEAGSCGVDAGMLSAIPMELIEAWGPSRTSDGSLKKLQRLGVIVNVEVPQQVNIVDDSPRGGDWEIGHMVKVITSDNDPYRDDSRTEDE